MSAPFLNSKYLKWYIFVLVSSCVYQNTIGHHLTNVFATANNNETKDICEKTEHLAQDVSKENDFNDASFVTQLFENFLNSNVSNPCKDSLVIYFSEVIDLKPWALEMLDASGKIPSSFFSVTMIDYGSPEDCIKIKAISNEGDSLFKGKYCMMHLRHPLFQTPYRNPHIGKSYNEAFGVPPDWIRYDIENVIPLRFGFYGGICMPSTCTDEDLNNAISTIVEPLGVDVTLTDCQVEEPLKVPFSAKLFMMFLVILLLVCISGTILDLKDHKMKEKLKSSDEALFRQVLKAFSFYTNTKELFDVSPKKSSFDFIHGFRLLLCLLIVWAHTMIYPTYWKEMRYKNFSFIFEFMHSFTENNGPVIVDSFFVISGFLLTYSSWKRIEQTEGHPNIFEYILQRYCRLTPPVIFLMSLYLVLPFISSGPIWNSSWEYELENCNQNGWKEFLYIQNFTPIIEICMVHTWYTANTMQHLIISLPLIIATYRYPKAGIFLGLILYFLPSIYFFYISIGHQFPFMAFNSLKYTHLSEKIASTLYVCSSYHLPPNLIGMLTGWVYLKYGKQKLPKIWIVCGWIASTLCFFYILGIVYIPTKNVMTMAFYNSFRPSITGFATGWVLYACSTGQGGIVDKLFSLKALIPLSRLSYSIFLVHPLYLSFRDAINAERYYMDRISQTGEFSLYLLFSIFAAFIVYVIIEEPFNKLYDILKKRFTSSTPPIDAK